MPSLASVLTMAKKPKPVVRRRRVEELNRSPALGLLNKLMNIGIVPPLLLGLAGWIYHGIEDTKTQVQLLQNTVLEQHAGTAGDIRRIEDGMKALWQAIGKLMDGKR